MPPSKATRSNLTLDDYERLEAGLTNGRSLTGRAFPPLWIGGRGMHGAAGGNPMLPLLPLGPRPWDPLSPSTNPSSPLPRGHSWVPFAENVVLPRFLPPPPSSLRPQIRRERERDRLMNERQTDPSLTAFFSTLCFGRPNLAPHICTRSCFIDRGL